jgi:hypothetical protein
MRIPPRHPFSEDASHGYAEITPARHRRRRRITMPMIDVYATAGTFADPHKLAADLATAVMAVEQVPDIPMFRQNTAAFVHELPGGALSNVEGDSNYVRIQVLTNADALDRAKQPGGAWPAMPTPTQNSSWLPAPR